MTDTAALVPDGTTPLIAEIVHRDMPSRNCTLTAILVVVGELAGGEKSLRCLAAQTMVGEMELILTSDSRATLEQAAPYLEAFGAVQLIRGDVTRLPHLRAACAERAQTAIIAFNEDHSFVEPGWAAEILSAFDSKPYVDAVAAGMANPNPYHPVSRCQFAAYFSPFATDRWPVGRHTTPGLPWHNTVYRASALHAVTDAGGDVGTEMEVEGSLQASIRRVLPHGQFVLTTLTTIHHANVSRLSPACRHAVLGGRLFAAYRARSMRWSRSRRLLQASAAPLVPLVRVWRDRAQLNAYSRGFGDYVRLLLHAAVMAGAHATGEFLGLVFGITLEHVMRYSDFESRRARFVHDSDRAILAA